jgi:fructose-1,6-bisphosphatase-3
MEELLFKDSVLSNKEEYYHNIIKNVVELKAANRLITCLAELIRELVVDHLHVVGDIYDRGPAPDKIMDLLMKKKSLDIQWGNHDVIWMGAASGSKVLIANVIRICARYDNLEVIEDSYGISLRPLISFADRHYPNAHIEEFMPKIDSDAVHFPEEDKQLARVQQAIAIIQFKLEAQIIKRHPEFKADKRLLLDKINFNNQTIEVDGKNYPLKNTYFPTVDANDPYQLTEEEEWLMGRLQNDFLKSERLHKHVGFLFNKGSMYLVYNNNLLIHGCVPLNEDGSFMEVEIKGEKYGGKPLMDKYERVLRKSYANRQRDERENPDLDYVWYIWQGSGSSLFGKSDMTTFERYYIADKSTHEEIKNPYYYLREEQNIIEDILLEFNIDRDKGHIVNGHTPVKERKGEDPIKANGKLIVIDGGYAKAYQSTTGLAGYTLLYNSFGMQLVSHQPFTSIEDAIENETDIVSTRRVVDKELERKTVRETDVGTTLSHQIKDLKKLLLAYREALIIQSLKK